MHAQPGAARTRRRKSVQDPGPSDRCRGYEKAQATVDVGFSPCFLAAQAKGRRKTIPAAFLRQSGASDHLLSRPIALSQGLLDAIQGLQGLAELGVSRLG